jgi:2-polyprenyl-3-methyl-5-hydroxy-6-metoxy-1,4-benzoquinol methylase
MDQCSVEHYNQKWEECIKRLPTGGSYAFQYRQYGHDVVKSLIPDGSRVFDYACGLGIIDIQLEREKNCIVAGCDFSDVAIKFVQSQVVNPHAFTVGDQFHGDEYDFILAIQFLEHIKHAREWVEECLVRAPKLICVLPNNYLRHGEHIDMAWGSFEEFEALFKGITHTWVKTNYPSHLHSAWRHPIVMFER